MKHYYTSDYTASHPKTQYSSQPLPPAPQIPQTVHSATEINAMVNTIHISLELFSFPLLHIPLYSLPVIYPFCSQEWW
jgi:hypothetical protein